LDIVKAAAFTNSNENFKAKTAELKKMGLGGIQHYPATEEPINGHTMDAIYLCILQMIVPDNILIQDSPV
jgi:hypothetical protein